MRIDLHDKTVLLGVTGSVSAYKACEIARLFVKTGADVHVVMTPAAERFVSALTFEALTRNPVLTETSESWSGTLNHIDIGKRADVFIVAPATANTLNKLSRGIADNILLQTALAYAGPLVVAPAANTQMLHNRYTAVSIKTLKAGGITVVAPQIKTLACGDEGNGALAEPTEIFHQGAKAMLSDPFWQLRRVVVTGGGTRENIDDIRYISNYSSGKMAKAIATALWLKGADVRYITTADTDTLPQEVDTVKIESAREMLDFTVDAVHAAKKGVTTKTATNSTDAPHIVQKKPYLFMVAAVSDYRPKYPQQGKLKKESLGDTWTLELEQTPDILSTIRKDNLVTIGFKAETDAEKGEANAKAMLLAKELDAVCYNRIADKQSFGTDDHTVTCLMRDKHVKLKTKPKALLAFDILETLKSLDDA